MRHGQQEPAASQNPHFSGLTELGRHEARAIGGKLDVDISETKIFSVNNMRSLSTIALALYPHITDKEIPEVIQDLKDNDQLIVTPKLSYLPIEDRDFEDKLASSFSQGKALKFLVEHSDEYKSESGALISSFSTLAHEAASTIDYFIQKIHEYNEELASQQEREIYRIYCGREFVYAGFRAKIIGNTQGIRSRDEYVDWYSDTVEWSHRARQELAIGRVQKNLDSSVSVKLKDSYGEMQLSTDEVQNVINEYNDSFTPSRERGI